MWKRVLGLALALLLALCAGPGVELVFGVPVADGPTGRVFNLNGSWIRGSVALGDLNGDGVADVVVGGSDGIVHAFNVRTGSELWHYDTGTAPIEGKAAVGDLDGDGCNEVVIGVGSTFAPQAPGGLWAFDCTGNYLWHHVSGDFNTDGVPDGVFSTPALADLDGNDGGKLEIVYGAWDGYVRALNHDGTTLWQDFVRDTVWSSPAVGDLDHDGRLEVVIGTDAHWEPAFGTVDGGKIYAFNGEDGSPVPGFFRQVDEVIGSSPALGDINGDGWLEIVVGTGDCYENPECASGGRTHPTTDALYGWDRFGNPLPGWPVPLSESTFASPALGDLDGDGDLEIVVNTGDGYVNVFRGDGSGVPGWPRLVTTPGPYHFPAQASPLLADLTGDGGLEVILPSAWEIVVWNRYGQQLTRTEMPHDPDIWDLQAEYTVHGTPAVGDVDGDGRAELIAAGARAGGATGALYVWDFDDTGVDETSAWSCFRRDSLNHARFAVPPVLSVGPSSVLLMHQTGSGSTESATLWVVNEGEGEIEWQVQSAPAGVTVSPLHGTVDREGQVLELTVSVSGYQTGTHALGEIWLAGSAGGDAVNGSPASVALTLYVGRVHRTFLPLALREEP